MRHIIWVLATCVISGPLHAQAYSITTLLRHGEWNGVGLNTGEELRIQFLPAEPGLQVARVTVTRLFGAGPSTTMTFTGSLMASTVTAETHGMPEADTICGMLSGQGNLCMLVEAELDGYVPGDNGSKLYSLVLRIKITNPMSDVAVVREPSAYGQLAFDGWLRNRLPLEIAADGRIIW